MKTLVFSAFISAILSSHAYSAEILVEGLTISKIRAVGNYQEGTTYDNTLEIWFSTPVAFSLSGCNAHDRLEIDAKNTHMISAALIAYSAGKKVAINIDNALPIRNGMCEISYIDLLP